MAQRTLRHHSIEAGIALLEARGVKPRTLINIGAADGHLGVHLQSLGLIADAALVNIDAQPVYEDSLRRIAEALGGHYRICAVGRADGELGLTRGAHPYWSSLRPAGDPYWERVPNAGDETVRVPVRRLDGLVAELRLEPPFLLFMDVQGAEADVLDGAPTTLAATDAVILEADIDDFSLLHGRLDVAGFRLFDLAEFQRMPDQTLGWFYPLYVKPQFLPRGAQRAFWAESRTAEMIEAQRDRRREILASLEAQLPRLRARRERS
jgi:FkbM family methyltransferase